MKKKWKIIGWSTLALLVSAGAIAIYSVHASLEAVHDSYAQWDAALSIIHHMKTHDGEWPKNWSDVEAACASAPDLRGPGWSNMKARVEIDFSADLNDLANNEEDTAPFRAVWLTNGKKHHWSGAEPNALIYRYLKGKNTEQKN